MPLYAHREDCTIDRTGTDDFPKSVTVYNSEGQAILVVDDTWTDQQIWTALKFANRTYDAGFKVGESAKAREITRALGLK